MNMKPVAVNIARACTLALIFGVTVPALSQESRSTELDGSSARSAGARPTGRIIVKWRPPARPLSMNARSAKASAAAGFALKSSRPPGSDIEALVPDRALSHAELAHAVAQLEAAADVELASIEYRRKLHALPNDPLLPQQWHLLSGQPAATRSDAAWDITQGNASIVIAVLDSGVRPEHPDLQGKLLPGHDFIGNPLVSNDGDGRDSDASDPGDWVTRQEVEQNPNDFLDEDCLNDGQDVRSSWHGTRVAGLIGARTNNADGIAGNAWQSRILPVRVMGKCGGSDLDIVDGMRWAAGIPVDGMTNPNPAHVINLSLGGDGPCTRLYQSAVNDVTALGVLVVVSAGNEGHDVSAPANCDGVLSVAGLRHAGTKVGFSNLGPHVGISAPGGNCVNTLGPCLFSIVVATNSGSTTPLASVYTDQLNFNVGTSFSAPMVASAAALLLAVNGSLTPAQTILLLKASASAFPTQSGIRTCTVPSIGSPVQDSECNCTTSTCGAGMLNTGAAVAAALRPLAVLSTTGTVAAGATITIDGSSSFASQGRTIAAHQWSVTDVVGATPSVGNTSQASTTLQIPGQSEFTLQLTVTDDQGTQDTKEIVMVTPAAPAPTTPQPSSPPIGGSGGGGSSGWELLLLALLGVGNCIGARARDRSA